MSSQSIKPTVAIIGAGISGLTTAYELTKAGYEVTVFEKEDYVGGRMATKYIDGLAIDVGALLLIESYDVIKGYLEELNFETDPINNPPIIGKTMLFKDQKPYLYTLGSLFLDIFKFDFLSWGDRLKMCYKLPQLNNLLKRIDISFFDLVDNSDEWDKESMFSYFEREYSLEIAQYIFEPVVRAAELHSSREVSLEVALGHMKSTLGSNYFNSPVDMGALTRAFGDKIQNLKLGTAVKGVSNLESGKIEIDLGNADKSIFDFLVIATTSSVAKSILKTPTSAQKEFLPIPSFSTSLSVAFKVSVGSFNTDWCIGTFPYPDSGMIASVGTMECKGGKYVNNGYSGFMTYFQEEYVLQHGVLEWDDKRIYDTVRSEVARIYPGVAEQLATNSDFMPGINIERFPEALAKYPAGYPTRLRQFWKDGQGDNNIYFAGDWMGSLWTEGSVRTGARVAKAIIAKDSLQI